MPIIQGNGGELKQHGLHTWMSQTKGFSGCWMQICLA